MQGIRFLATVALIMTSAALAIAGSDAKFGHGRPSWELYDAILADLKLSAAQADQIRTLRETFQKDLTPLRRQKFEKWAELKLLWRRTHPDVAEIKSKQQEIFDLKRLLVDKVTDFRLAVRNVLTPEQLSQFIELESNLWRHPARR